MKIFNQSTNLSDTPAIVINLEEEQKIEREAMGLVELHDFIKAHPDSAAKEAAKFMPPVDARVVNKALQFIALRDKKDKS